jgi:hypothetical protein
MNPKLLLFMLLLVGPTTCPNINANQLDENDNSRVFEWTKAKSGDFQRWLMQHEKLLGQCDACRLLVSWSNEGEAVGTADFNIAEILVLPEDSSNTKLLIRHPESGINLRVGVDYAPSYLSRNEPLIIRMALAFEGDAKGVFYELDRTQAEALREKSWKYLSLTKDIKIGKRIYSFIFHCENGKTYQKMLRRSLRR